MPLRNTYITSIYILPSGAFHNNNKYAPILHFDLHGYRIGPILIGTAVLIENKQINKLKFGYIIKR